MNHPDAAAVETSLGPLTSVERINEGVVHAVFRAKVNGQPVVLKIRGEECSGLPGVKIDPRDIQHEKFAIELLWSLFPSVFPRLLEFSEDKSFILMSDTMPARFSLENAFATAAATQQVLRRLGQTLAEVHIRIAPIGHGIRDDDDEAYYSSNLYYRLGYQNDVVLNSTISQLRSLPRQLILGDLSPKNIGVEPDDRITICDLEGVHRGNVVFDLGFLIGHIVLHSIRDPQQALALTEAFLLAYLNINPCLDPNDLLLKKLALGAMLCRLRNPVIPYKLDGSASWRHQEAIEAGRLLRQDGLTWHEITEVLAGVDPA